MRRTRAIMGASIIFPSSAKAPVPCAAAANIVLVQHVEHAGTDEAAPAGDGGQRQYGGGHHDRAQAIEEIAATDGFMPSVIGAAGAPEVVVNRVGRGDPATIDQVLAAIVAGFSIGDASLVAGRCLDADGLELGNDEPAGPRRLLPRHVGRQERTAKRQNIQAMAAGLARLNKTRWDFSVSDSAA